MIFELSGFFPLPERANGALDALNRSGFDTSSASLVTGEDAYNLLHKRLAAAKRGRAAAGAAICGAIALVIGGIVFLPAGTENYPWLLVASLVAVFAMIGAAIGGYYGMAVERESVLVGLLIGGNRLEEAKDILRAAGGRFVGVRAIGGEQRSYSNA